MRDHDDPGIGVMKIAISVSGDSIDSPFEPRFGRTPVFCIINTDTDEWAAQRNPATSTTGGAGVQAAQFIARLGANAAVSGAFGPSAARTLRAAEIAMYSVPAHQAATAREVLAMFKNGELTKTTAATSAGHLGGSA